MAAPGEMRRGDRPVPVAIVLTSFDAGGTERQMIELMRRLDRGRFEVHACCFHRRGAWLPLVQGAVHSIAEFPISGFGRPATWRQMGEFARWCRTKDVQVVHACDFYANVFALPAAAWARVPLRIGSRRDLNPGRSAAQSGLQRLAYAAAHRIVANSGAAAQRLASERVPGRKIAVIPNGVDVSRFPAPPARTGPIRRIVTVANLRPEKAHEVLIEAAARLAPRHPDLQFQFVGDGSCRPVLEALIQARGLQQRIHLLGHRDDVPALLAAADLFVLPSRTEAFPNGIIEAMAAALPVVASGVGGMLELVRPGFTGSLVAPDDVGALTAAMQDLIEAPDRARAMGEEGRRDALSRFSFDRMVYAFEQLYTAPLVSRTGAGAAPMAAA